MGKNNKNQHRRKTNTPRRKHNNAGKQKTKTNKINTISNPPHKRQQDMKHPENSKQKSKKLTPQE